MLLTHFPQLLPQLHHGQCVEAAELIKPKTLSPYHYSDTDLSELPERLSGMEVKIIDSLR